MPIEIEIVDPSNDIIKSGPMATAEIKIIVLDGDFDGGKNGEWTEKGFEEHVVVPRKGKGPLLVGSSVFHLHDGVGRISKVKFTDNSKWSRSENFRLGVKMHGGIGMAGDVREGISNAFRVKDRHGEKIRKDRPLSMNDEVCCLRGISKDGPFHKKLKDNKINTVRDFLCYCSNHPLNTLRYMLGMGKGKWENTYGHAMESKMSSDIVPYAPDQISFDVPVSDSPQISDVLVQHNNGFQQFASYAESEHPISGISTSPQSLPPINLEFESWNTFETNNITRVGSCWERTEHLMSSWKALMERNGRSDVPVSNSPQISDVLAQHNNGFQQFTSYAESEHPISGISTSPQSLPPINLEFESWNTLETNNITRVGSSWEGTEHLMTSWNVQMEGNGRSDVPVSNSPQIFDVLKRLLTGILKEIIMEVLIKKSGAIKHARWSRESRYSETSSPGHNAYDLSLIRFDRPLEDLSPIFSNGHLMDSDNYTDLW